MQQSSLLKTKLYVPPVRPKLVSRPRLFANIIFLPLFGWKLYRLSRAKDVMGG